MYQVTVVEVLVFTWINPELERVCCMKIYCVPAAVAFVVFKTVCVALPLCAICVRLGYPSVHSKKHVIEFGVAD